jgi:hypothetical protein
VTVGIVGDGLYVFLLDSAKRKDLVEDGRFRAPCHQDQAKPDEFSVRGRARLVPAGETRDAVASGWFFEVDDTYWLFELRSSRRSSASAAPTSGHPGTRVGAPPPPESRRGSRPGNPAVSASPYRGVVPARPRVDPEALLADVDPEQREAILATSGPVAIHAGAGSGKTRVISRRTAYAIATDVVPRTRCWSSRSPIAPPTRWWSGCGRSGCRASPREPSTPTR